MAEAVRLVIWDLDDTFWRGTLTEGGIQYVRAHHDIVVELALRGIMSSICSKNDPNQIIPILAANEILDYFVFPSISWEPKGTRVATIIEAIQLRAPTVMFIDDNPQNRAEVLSKVPEIQIEDDKFIKYILNDLRFIGKNDRKLTRLQQYKLLEIRKRDKSQAIGGNEEFLRGCDIRVHIEYDVVLHIDRAIELITRTNQLNFTKKMLPEHAEEARRMLLNEMNGHNRQAGLVHVIDKYGDYGFVGFFETETMRDKIEPGSANSHLIHFCFSCRTLGMLVEQWVYDYLRRPELKVVGEVLTDLAVPRTVDWVRLVPSIEQVASQLPRAAPKMIVWGGCEANAVGVYLAAHVDDIEIYGNYTASMVFSRINSAIQALETSDRDPESFAAEARGLGIPIHLSAVDVFGNAPHGTAFVFNCSRDHNNAHLYLHKTAGWVVEVELRFLPGVDLIGLSYKDIIGHLDRRPHFDAAQREETIRLWKHVRENYTLIRPSDRDRIGAIRALIDRVPEGSKLILCVDHDEERAPDGEIRQVPSLTSCAAALRDLAGEYPHVGFVAVSEILEDHHEIQDGNHYDRIVYLRFANRVIETLGEPSAKKESAIRRGPSHRPSDFEYNLIRDPALHLVVDGTTVHAASKIDGVYSFSLATGFHDIRIYSRNAVPSEVLSGTADIRRLGVATSRIVARDKDLTLMVGHKYPDLGVGFYPPEAKHRWTDGCARLSGSLLSAFTRPFVLEIHVVLALGYPGNRTIAA